MSGLVLELQRAALDESTPIGSLLRRALTLASKLGIQEFEDWATAELEGYKKEQPIPAYREVLGTPKVHNPFRGYQDIHFESAEIAKQVATMKLPFPIDVMAGAGKNGKPSGVAITFSAESEQVLMDMMEFPLKPSLHLSEATVRGLLGQVRNIILQWSLKLEKRGVLGDGLSFTAAERSKASEIHVETLIQNVSGSQIQVRSPGATLTVDPTSQVGEIRELVAVLAKALSRRGIPDSEEVNELRAELATLKAQIESPKPKRAILGESLSSLRSILEGATGQVLADSLPTALAILGRLTGSG